MSLNFTCKERAQAQSYREMVRRVRTRVGSRAPARPPGFRARQIDVQHKAAISRLFCAATAVRTGCEIFGVHVAHVRFSDHRAGARNPGLQRKPDDRWTVPLSPLEHRLQHSMSEAAYWAELCINAHTLAAELWSASSSEVAMVETLRQTVNIARRSKSRVGQ